MNKNILHFLVIILFSCLLILILSEKKNINTQNGNIVGKCGKYETREIKINDKIIRAEISDTDCKRKLGLSGREPLGDNEGMLFVFEKTGNYGFWMKDMSFPIDILWLSEDFEVVGLEKNVSTSTYPQIFGQKYLARYILEVNFGFLDSNGVKVGNKITFFKK